MSEDNHPPLRPRVPPDRPADEAFDEEFDEAAAADDEAGEGYDAAADGDEDSGPGGNRFGNGSHDLPLEAPFPDRYEDEWGLDHAAAVEAMNERLRLDPEDAEALAERGRRWVNLGQYERALADFAAALCVDDEDTDGLWGQAMVWACCPDERFRNGPAALESAELADSLGGSSLLVFGGGRLGFSMDYKEAIAAAYAEMGRFDEAVRHIDMALALLDAAMPQPGVSRRLREIRRLYEARTPYRWLPVSAEAAAAGARLAAASGDAFSPFDVMMAGSGVTGAEPQLPAVVLTPELRERLEAEFPVTAGSLSVRNLRAAKLHRLLALPRLAEVERLDISGDVDEETARLLAASAAALPIRSLQLGNNSLRARAAAALAGGDWSRLRELSVYVNHIEDDGAEALAGARLPEVESLRLSSNDIGDAAAAVLLSAARWPKLARLDLSSNRLNRAAMRALAENPTLTGLVELDLGFNRIDAAGAAALARAALPRLESLSLTSNHLRDAGAVELSRAGFLGTLKTLSLYGNRIGAAGLQALVGCCGWGTLEDLDLSDNRLGDDAMAVLASATHLLPRVLGLCGNRIGPAGVAALARSPVCAGLVSLRLGDGVGGDETNRIGSEGARALAESPHLANLDRLVVVRDGVGETEAALLEERFEYRLEWI